ncbi:hypothetical protein, variant [Verruconis gallopava]|uniref:BTB domain-containing protein n=1 Tax=Verruconis gallopava TaxID=253628 RepID=A0A0D2AQZ7_9PEZI|nr:uncharacterized protein PV09_07081 [Verruconis gallopava]XP_016211479.1 hypothetical protein, variant [Verruconis gallopava]KIW01609.1 hypothetical protein PV09_07081 [Verruconis gallopava]KIW01610.1 hypothetical protein, variant [Verruconis gallopava]
MLRLTPGNSRSNTLDSTVSDPATLYAASSAGGNMYAQRGVNGSQTNLYRLNTNDLAPDREGQARTPASGFQGNPSPAMPSVAGVSSASSNSGLSGLVCNVHRTTGREPRPLVGASTTILGDKLYVFGGRKTSRSRPQLTNDLYELDLIRRHWTKLETTGDKPPPRYFHSVCALGDTKLVLFGGMSPATLPNGQPAAPDQPVNPQDPQPEVVALSDVHIYDVPTRSWMKINATNPPQGRYAHCATILPSSSVFSSPSAANSAIHHNPSSPSSPNSGTLGVTLDGDGGAEMIVVGGQDTANHYIEQINVFNLRSLSWTTAQPFGRSCGAYRSVTAPLSASAASKLGVPLTNSESRSGADRVEDATDGASALLIYSNYNFLDVRLELQVRLPDGQLIEKDMLATPSPPGLRFPNGGIIDNHFVVSGTFLTSSKQEYALWALDLRKLTWSRIDAGATTFSQGSWNRGVLWNRRNTYVILGNRKRSLAEDYNHRRINFTNICMVELEAFGLYDNPRRKCPSSGYVSASAKQTDLLVDRHAGGRPLLKSAEDLGSLALSLTELSDMDFVAMNGDRLPANSHIVSRRWGPYFKHIMAEAMASTDTNDTATLRPQAEFAPQRQSSVTITPSLSSGYSTGSSTLVPPGSILDSTAAPGIFDPSRNINPARRPRALYLPHTTLTIQALLHFLYTSSLPPLNSNLCTPQILCSLLQIARPYKIDGLLEAVVERLHLVLDNRNTAAIFNAAAMAAGGGDGVVFFNKGLEAATGEMGSRSNGDLPQEDSDTEGLTASRLRSLRIDTEITRPATSMSAQSGHSDDASSADPDGPSDGDRTMSLTNDVGENQDVWNGSLSSVVGLQKRGLRGLMEGRRIRERSGGLGMGGPGSGVGEANRVGLGIA